MGPRADNLFGLCGWERRFGQRMCRTVGDVVGVSQDLGLNMQ
jgi:hypothetical protein